MDITILNNINNRGGLIFKYGSGKAIAAISYLILLSIFSKKLSVHDFSTVVIAQSLSFFIILLGSLGQPQIVTYLNTTITYYEKSTLHIRHSINAFKIIFFAGFAICLASSFFVTFLIGSNEVSFFLIYFLLVASQSIQVFAGELCKSRSANWLSSLFGSSGGNGGAGSTLSSLLILFIWLQCGIKLEITSALAILVSGSFIANFIFCKFYFFKRLKKYFILSLPKYSNVGLPIFSQFQLGIKGMFNSLLILLIGQLDILIAAVFCTHAEVGDYAIASNIAKFISLSGMLITGAYSQKVGLALNAGSKCGLLIINKLTRFITAISFAVFIIAITIYYFHGFGNYFEIKTQSFTFSLIVLMLGHLFSSPFSLGPLSLITTGKFELSIYINIATLFVLFLSYLILIPSFGIYAISLLSALGMISMHFISSLLFKRLNRLG